MKRGFVYLAPYEAKARRTKGFLQAEAGLEETILEYPARGTLIAGTGGIRKIRIGDATGGRGKRGGYRF